MSQCQLCLSYIREIKQMSEQIKVKGILLNEQEKNYKAQVEGLQRQIDALKNLLTSKGILLNWEGDAEEELYEINQLVNPPIFKKVSYEAIELPMTDPIVPVKWDEGSKSFQEVKDDYEEAESFYDYTADDLNFDAARENRMKGGGKG